VTAPTPAGYRVEPALGRDVDPWLGSIAEEVRDNGEGGVYFSPRSRHDPPPLRTAEAILGYVARMAKGHGEPGWFRLWVARAEASGEIVGHVDLSGGRMVTELHRSELGMGILRPHRGKGLGPALLDAAITWARASGLAWIELGVFACNPRARRLYERAGFAVIGGVPDRFRVDGVVIDDVRMALRLG
jgi:RimJ/RimL family protein N-acetyltransferase